MTDAPVDVRNVEQRLQAERDRAAHYRAALDQASAKYRAEVSELRVELHEARAEISRLSRRAPTRVRLAELERRMDAVEARDGCYD